MRSLLNRFHPSLIFLAVVLAVAFCTYCRFRQQFVGDSDPFGYYQQGQLLRQGHIELPLELPLDRFPAAVPYGYVADGDRALPTYPPGYPLLLALAGFLHLEYLVSPLAGLLSAIIFYLLARDLTGPWTAAVFTLLWAFFPIVAFSSMGVMSDMTAATLLLAAYWLYQRERFLFSALVLGFGISVRPTSVLFVAALVLPLWRDRRLIRYGLWLAVPCTLYALYNLVLHGAPWRTGYEDVTNELQSRVFFSHLAFYGYETFRQLGLPLALLALVGMAMPHRDRLFKLVWFLLFLGFYSFWTAGGDRWWWTRFLLPAYAPLFLFAIIGFERSRTWLLKQIVTPNWRPVLGAAMLVGLAFIPLYHIRLARRERDVWVLHKGFEYLDTVSRMAVVASPGSYVGSLEFAGAQLLYSDLNSFLSISENSLPLVQEVLSRGHDTYIVVEPWHRERDVILKLLTRFPHKRLPDIPIWNGLEVYQLQLPAAAAL